MTTSTPTKKFMRTMLVLFALAGVMLCTMACVDTNITVDKFEKKAKEKLSKELRNPRAVLRQYVEMLHLTVDVYSARIESISITTKDGSQYAQKNGECNVATIRAIVVMNWNGFFHKAGTTVLQIDGHWDDSKQEFAHDKTKVTYTDALITLNEETLLELGLCLLALCLI